MSFFGLGRDMNLTKVLLTIAALMALAMPACAHGGAKSAANVAMPADAESANEPKNLKDLDDVVLGLSGFEGRASKYNKDEWNFVLGYAHFMHGRPKDAEHYFSKVSGKLPKLEDYILYYRANIANQLGQHSKAVGYLDLLKANYPSSAWRPDAAIQKAIALSGLNRFSEATGILDKQLDVATDVNRSEIERLIAWTYIKQGNSQAAISYVKTMALAAGGDRDLEELKGLFAEIKKRYDVDVDGWLQSPSNELRLAESFAADSQWYDAAGRLEKLLASGKLDGSQKVRSKWLLARAYRWIHRYGESIALMEELRRSPAGRRISGLSTSLATVYAKKNDYKKAIAIRKSLLGRLPPGSRAAANMAYKIAFLYVDEDKYKEAIPLWRQVASMRSAGRNRTLARWYIGWCYFMIKDYEGALASFNDLLKSGAKGASIADRVMYWKGRALRALGRKSDARDAFSEVIGKYPRGYYAELSRRRIAGDTRSLGDFPLAKGSWGGPRLWKPQAAGAASDGPHMSRAVELDRLGLHAEVARELKYANFNASADAAEVGLWLAWNNYAHDIAYRLAQRKFRGALKRTPGKDGFAYFVWEQAYPKAYDPVVIRLDSKGDIDPMLVWAIMRNESAFRPRVISPAGAVGLMQLMPTTANLMASTLGDGKVSVTDLYRPATNIAYGITYLEKLASLFPGNAVAVIASYNAGEQAVGRWLENGSYADIEEWIEEIPYKETNLYVKKVLTSYWRYQRLYGNQVRVASRNGKSSGTRDLPGVTGNTKTKVPSTK